MLHSRYTSAICFTHCGVYVPVSASNSSPTHSPFGVHVFALYVCVCISALQIGSSVPFFLGEGNGTPLQSSCLENPMDGGAWWAAVHGVAKRWTQLSDFTFSFHFHALEKAMEPHSSILAWRIPGMAEPGGLPSMGSHRVRHA